MAVPPEDHSGSDRRGLMRVRVAPKNNSKKSLWGKFLLWLKKFSATPEAKKSKEIIEEYLEESLDSGLEHLRQPKFANEKAKAEIQNLVERTRSERNEEERRGHREDLDLQKIAAEIRKTEAEAFQIETDTALKLIDGMTLRGFEVGVEFSQAQNRVMVVKAKSPSVRRYEAIDPILGYDIDRLDLTTSTRDILRDEGVYYIGDLVRKTEVGLMDVRRLSKLSIMQIKEELAAHDLSLGMHLEKLELTADNEFIIKV